MYGNAYTTGTLATGAMVAATTGWSVAGWCTLGVAAAVAVYMTIRRLSRRSRS